MNNAGDKTMVNRRDFLKLGIMGAAGTTLTWKELAQASYDLFAAANLTPVYRTLGKTGLKTSIVSFGAMLTPEHEVIRAGLDMGINYIDTARKYMNGKNEAVVGKAIKGIRDKVFVATKTLPTSNTKEDILRDVETSLRELQTDYIDVIQLHNLTGSDRAFIPEVQEALARLREQGKVRFFGVTSHTNQSDVLNAIANDPDRFFDVALIGYNFKSGPEVRQSIARAAKANIGVVAMKTQAGGYKTDLLGFVSPHQAALKWTLQDKNVTTAIPGMKDMSMLKEDIAVMWMNLSSADQQILERYSRAIESYYCRLCAQCEPACPNHVEISTINRCLMYAEGYGELALARSTYAEIRAGASASACLSCEQCIAKCVNGINIAGKMQKAQTLFS